MDLARHTDINLTLARYTHTVVADRARALESLPDLSTSPEPQHLRATGTTDAAAHDDSAASCAQQYPQQLERDAVRDDATECNEPEENSPPADSRKSLSVAGVCDAVRNGAIPDMTADGGNRTHNLSFTKAVLYR